MWNNEKTNLIYFIFSINRVIRTIYIVSTSTHTTDNIKFMVGDLSFHFKIISFT